jgi:hypothetical protein
MDVSPCGWFLVTSAAGCSGVSISEPARNFLHCSTWSNPSNYRLQHFWNYCGLFQRRGVFLLRKTRPCSGEFGLDSI